MIGINVHHKRADVKPSTFGATPSQAGKNLQMSPSCQPVSRRRHPYQRSTASNSSATSRCPMARRNSHSTRSACSCAISGSRAVCSLSSRSTASSARRSTASGRKARSCFRSWAISCRADVMLLPSVDTLEAVIGTRAPGRGIPGLLECRRPNRNELQPGCRGTAAGPPRSIRRLHRWNSTYSPAAVSRRNRFPGTEQGWVDRITITIAGVPAVKMAIRK